MITPLPLTFGEVMWLTEGIGSLAYWPPPGAAHLPGTAVTLMDDLGGGPLFRARLIAMLRLRDRDENATTVLDCTRQELWLIDATIQMQGTPARFIKLPDGLPLATLQRKVWDALIADYIDADELPARLCGELETENGDSAAARDRAADETRTRLDALLARAQSDSAARAEQDAVHRPGHDAGTGEDLPAATAGGSLGGVVIPPEWFEDYGGGVPV